MVYIIVKVVKIHEKQKNLKKESVKYVKIETRVCKMFCRFTVHETFESKYSNVKFIYHICETLFHCFSHTEHTLLQGS